MMMVTWNCDLMLLQYPMSSIPMLLSERHDARVISMPGVLRIHDSKKGQGTWTGAFCGAGTTDPEETTWGVGAFWTTDCKPTNQQNPLQINSDNATKTEHKPRHFKRGFISQCHDISSMPSWYLKYAVPCPAKRWWPVHGDLCFDCVFWKRLGIRWIGK